MNGYDELGPKEQAMVRASWREAIDRLSAGLNLRSEFEAAGEPFSELDEDGQVVTHYPKTQSASLG